MRIDIATLFPEAFAPLGVGVIGRAVESGLLEVNIVNIRDYTLDKHGKCDDTPFGGGAGMVMTPQPIHDAISALDPDHEALRIYMSPKGRTLCQSMVKELAARDRLLFLCGSYEGIDERVLELDIDFEISIGYYVLSCGEFAAMVIVIAVARYV